MRRGCELLFVACLGGCWGKAAIDMTGTYHVTSHVASACTDDMPVATPAQYVRFVSSAGGYTMQVCSSIDANTCSDVAELTDPIDGDGWRQNERTVVDGLGMDTCQLELVEGTAYLDDDTWLTVDITTYRSAPFDRSAPECADPPDERFDELPCESHVKISATQLTTL
ncbi:MAG TPA: hypothetical protein VIV11_19325 [Kofleriaceae bacterium]